MKDEKDGDIWIIREKDTEMRIVNKEKEALL